MIQRSSVSSPGALTGEGNCFSINYFNGAAPGEGESFRRHVGTQTRGFEETAANLCLKSVT